MTNEELQKATIKADMELQRLKDNIHELYEENKQLKEDKKKAIKYIKEKQIQNEYTDRCGFRVKENKWWLEDSDILLEILGDKE